MEDLPKMWGLTQLSPHPRSLFWECPHRKALPYTYHTLLHFTRKEPLPSSLHQPTIWFLTCLVVWLFYEASESVTQWTSLNALGLWQLPLKFETIMTGGSWNQTLKEPLPSSGGQTTIWFVTCWLFWLFYEPSDIVHIFECPMLLSTPFEIRNHIEKVLDLLDLAGPKLSTTSFCLHIDKEKWSLPHFCSESVEFFYQLVHLDFQPVEMKISKLINSSDKPVWKLPSCST